MSVRAQARSADRWLYGLACGLALAAIAVHVPGHVSMDSSEQLYEALTGRSLSWSPPFMSALLRLLGGGSTATALFMGGSVLLTYAGFALALAAGTRQPGRHAASWAWLRVVAVAILIANPLVFLYVGIVWKDVLLAALLAATAGLLLLSESALPAMRRRLCLGAVLLLVPLLLVRQQGIVLAPPLLAVAAAGIAGTRIRARDAGWWRRWLGVVAVYLLLCWAASAGIGLLIKGNDAKSTTVGFAAVQRYDLTGMLALGGTPTAQMPKALSNPAFLSAVKRSYGADRIDRVFADPVVLAGFLSVDTAPLAAAWWSMISDRPRLFLGVKRRQFAWLIGAQRLDRCLPLHVGVEGNARYLWAVGMQPGIDRYDQQLHDVGMWLRHLPLYRHWLYLAILLVCVGWLAATWKKGNGPGASHALALALLAFYGAYAATTIACDFRYLYPGLVGTSVLAIFLLARRCGASPTSETACETAGETAVAP